MLARRLRGLAVLHPFPSALNAVLVLGLAIIAGAGLVPAAGLALAMLGVQFSIGATNDVLDEEFDARSQPEKPIPSGLIDRRIAIVLALGGAAIGLGVAALFGTTVLALAAVMLGAGLVYNAYLKRGPWAWVAFSVAFPVLPVYAWYGAVAEFPPRPELLLPVAALAGPALQLSNGLVDLERDRLAGLATLAGRLGHRRALTLMATLLAAIHGLAWLTLAGGGGMPPAAAALAAISGALALVGLVLSAQPSSDRRERGWQAQAASITVLALGWLAAAAVWTL